MIFYLLFLLDLNVKLIEMAIAHNLVSIVVDAGVSGEVGPSEWNDSHKGTIADFVINNEAPTGDIDGVNDTYTLANTPVVGSVKLYRNGMRDKESLHYSISGATITRLSGNILGTGDFLLADYLVTVT